MTKFFPILPLALLLVACGPTAESNTVGARQDDNTVEEIISEDRTADVLDEEESTAVLRIFPIIHGSTVLKYAGLTVFVDPYDGAERYAEFGAPDLVLITHSHGDHMDPKTLDGLLLETATLIAPQAVADALETNNFGTTTVLANGATTEFHGLNVRAVPAYNHPDGPTADFHPKGKFNGYVISFGEEEVYFSGDTQNVPEMADFGDIDYAFLCMNQPYTMTAAQAADAVMMLKPRVVYPYHYRNKDGTFTDLAEFAKLAKDKLPTVDIRMENWYPTK